MTHEEFSALRLREDKKLLADMEKAWLCYELLKLIDPDPFERAYYRRLEATADGLICKLESSMVRRYL